MKGTKWVKIKKEELMKRYDKLMGEKERELQHQYLEGLNKLNNLIGRR